MVDMRMGDDDLFDLKIMFAQNFEDVLDFVARIDHHGFARILVAHDRTVALERADGEDFVDHGAILTSPGPE